MPKFRFAPVSGNSSGFVDLAAGYFLLNGIFSALIALAGLGFLVSKHSVQPVNVLRLTIWIAAAVASFWTARLLGRREKRGGYFAIAFIALPFVPALFGQAIDAETIWWTAVSAIVLAVIWRDLDEHPAA